MLPKIAKRSDTVTPLLNSGNICICGKEGVLIRVR